MDHNYTVTIIICILSMLSLAIDVGKNNILNKSDIKWFRLSFILAAIGAGCEYLGVLLGRLRLVLPRHRPAQSPSFFCVVASCVSFALTASGRAHSLRCSSFSNRNRRFDLRGRITSSVMTAPLTVRPDLMVLF